MHLSKFCLYLLIWDEKRLLVIDLRFLYSFENSSQILEESVIIYLSRIWIIFLYSFIALDTY